MKDRQNDIMSHNMGLDQGSKKEEQSSYWNLFLDFTKFDFSPWNVVYENVSSIHGLIKVNHLSSFTRI